jgi:anti-anti-sigma factor
MVLAVSGGIDLATAPELQGMLMGAMDSAQAALVVDLGGVSFCDCRGVTALVAATRYAETAGGQMKFVNPSLAVRRLIHVLDAERVFELVGALHRAVASGAIRVHYQPKVSTATGTIVGFEALARWARGDGTVVAPSDFIPLAEEIGLIDAIGEQVLRQACLDAFGWAAQAPGAAPGVAVNVSGRQLVSGKLAANVAAALAGSGLPAERLSLEVTETALAEDLESAISALREVKALGVGVAVDDFGIGYSSLGYLSRFPIDELKVDKSFVQRMVSDPAVEAIVRSVIALSHTLGLRCTAEGVERQDQLDHLAALGCDFFQGYLFSPAVANDQVPPLLSAVVDRVIGVPTPGPGIAHGSPPSAIS